jgi:hypothetical protein
MLASIGSTAHIDLPSDCFLRRASSKASWSSHHQRGYFLISASVNPGYCRDVLLRVAFSHPTSIVRKAINIFWSWANQDRLDRCTHYSCDIGTVEIFDECF